MKRSDLAKLHLKWKRTPYQANRIVAVVGSMYSFAVNRGLVAEGLNPARGIEKRPEPIMLGDVPDAPNVRKIDVRVHPHTDNTGGQWLYAVVVRR